MKKWVLVASGALWPLIAFSGGLGYSPLLAVSGLLCIGFVAPRLRMRPYIWAVLALLAFVAISTKWSPRHINFIDIDYVKHTVAFRFEPLRLGSVLLWSAVMLEAARALEPAEARLVVKAAAWGIGIQLAVVAVSELFETQLLNFFYPTGTAPGVQNVKRNSILLALAAPFFIVSIGRKLPFASALVVEIGIVAATLALLILGGDDAAQVSLGAGLLCVAVVRLFPTSGFRVLGGGIAVLILTVPLTFGWITRAMGERTITDSATWRLAIWTRVLKLIDLDPIFGQGVGVLRTLDEKIPTGPFKGIILVPNHAHNMVLQLWAETGAVGASLAALAVLLAGMRMPEPRRLGRSGLLAAALAGQYLIVCLLSFDLWNDLWWGAAGTLGAFATALWRLEAVNQDADLAATASIEGGDAVVSEPGSVKEGEGRSEAAWSGAVRELSGLGRNWRAFTRR